MSRLTLTIETDNAAFQDGQLGPELGRILHNVAERVIKLAAYGPHIDGRPVDINGNTVGSFRHEVTE
jgi:hypothetical protein